MKKILVPVDFSKTSGRALHFALEIASRTACEITVVHIMGPFEGANNNVYDAFWLDQYAAQKKLDLDKWTTKIVQKSDLQNVMVHTQLEVDFTVSGIADMASAHHFDLTVMGSTGATGLKGLFLGSTAGGVIGKSKVPTLVVPRKAAFKKMSKLVLATDFWSDLDKKSMEVLRKLTEIEAVPLEVLHVLETKSEQPNEQKEADFRHKFKEIELRFQYNHHSDVAAGIEQYLESSKADLVCTIAHPHGPIHRLFIESTSRLLANQTHVPLLVLHD